MTFPTDRQRLADQLTIGSELIYLPRQDVEHLGLTRDAILQLTRQALVEHGHRRYEMPAKIGVHPYDNVFHHAMPAYLPGPGIVGMKWIACYPDNPRTVALPQTTGLLVLNDVDTGVPLAVMDSAWLTAMRTPAVTALAAAVLHPDATTFGMFGCGVQGIEHVRYAALAMPRLETVHVYDTNGAAADALIATLQSELEVRIIKGASPEAVTKSAEVLSSATVILRWPLAVVKDAWVTTGQTILPCDLNTFWDPRTTRRADKYLVDSVEEHELFASMGYFPDGLPEVAAEIGEVLAGVKPGREHADEIIVNSNIGMAVCDIAVGNALLHRALERGVGVRLPL
ncbi:ornithine cyclodeaminase family protein [Streptomyces sioyaensis]|uniref:ornithine cyclodeaminase family protein n=1 Tax=Streptomyces sioyaensis TaxID=67364 RepID=UPI003D73DC75